MQAKTQKTAEAKKTKEIPYPTKITYPNWYYTTVKNVNQP